MNRQIERRAQALIVVVGMLMLMSVMGVNFVSMARMEQGAVGNATVHIHAEFAMYAGLDRALAELQNCFRKDSWYGTLPGSKVAVLPYWLYRGEDLNGDGLRQIKTGEADMDQDGTLGCTLAKALAPSFWHGTYSDPRFMGRGYSGKIVTQVGQSSHVVRVDDLSSRIPLLGPMPGIDDAIPETEPDSLVGSGRMLATLVKLLRSRYGKGTPLASFQGYWPYLPKDLNDAMTRYPNQRFPNQLALLQAMPPDVAKVVSKYLTIYDWVDASTIKPPQGENVLPAGLNDGSSLLQPLRYKAIEMEPRAPVNINTAPMEVLVACLNGLKARVIVPGFLNHDSDKTALQTLALEEEYLKATNNNREMTAYNNVKNQYDRVDSDVSINLATAQEVAKKIIERRQKQAFASWQDLAEFLAGLIDPVLWRKGQVKVKPKIRLTPEQANLIWINANPNTNLNKDNPDFPDAYLYKLWSVPGNRDKKLFYRLDKTDLIVYTTEFCFHPTGYFTISSLGRWQDNNGMLLAEEPENTLVIKLFDIYKATTQRDFQETMDTEAGKNAAITIAPEVNKNAATACTYDGYITLAAKHFANSSPTPSLDKPLTEWQGVATTENLPNPLVGDQPGNQFCDGVFGDKEHVLAHDTAVLSKSSGQTTLLCFWYKPNWDVMDPWARPHSIMDANGAKATELFQIYNECKAVQPFPDDEARWSLFAWDKAAEDGKGAPLKFTITLPQGLSQNRWLFYALYWNDTKVGMRVNGKEQEIWKNKSLRIWVITDIKDTGKREAYMLFFLTDNPALQPWVSHNPQYWKGGPISTKYVNKDVDYNDGLLSGQEEYSRQQKEITVSNLQAKESKANYQLLYNKDEWKESTSITYKKGMVVDTKKGGKTYEGEPNQMPPQALAQDRLGAANQVLPLMKVIKDPKVRTPLERLYQEGDFRAAMWDATIQVASEKLVGLGEKFDISPAANYIHLGSFLKYIDKVDYRKQTSLASPSHGTYSELKVYHLTSLDNAKTMASDIFEAGRYENSDNASDPAYDSTLVQLGRIGATQMMLGGVRWTAYRPQDCRDFDKNSEGATTLEVRLYDADGKPLHAAPLTKAESSAVPVTTAPFFRYQVTFHPIDATKPIIAAPVLDDLTITYSTGWQCKEWATGGIIAEQ
jgi:hypothetical protein